MGVARAAGTVEGRAGIGVDAEGAAARTATSSPGDAARSGSGPSRERLAHRPALDGLRGLAVAAVVLYHAAAVDGVGWLSRWTRGGYLGVSAFFTLSGFLIASLLLAERRHRGSVSLAGFWERRARRLLPAVLATIAAVVVLTPVLGTEAQLATLPGDAWSSLLYVANWRFIVEGADYAAMFGGAPSPLRHLWSLAVEEQWYVLVPLAALAFAALGARRGWSRRALVVALCASAALATAWMVVVSGGTWDNRAYMGTDTRLAEMVIGALAAALVGRGLSVPPRIRRLLSRLAPLLLAVLVVSWAITPIGWDWLYRGGLSLHALVVAALIVAVVQPTGAVMRLLSLGALTALGRVSYGVYLFHWPLLWWLSGDRLGLGPTATLGVQVAATLGVAAISYRLVESPIRSRRVLRGRTGWLALLIGFGVVALLIVRIPEPDRSAVVALGSGQRIAVPTTLPAPEAPQQQPGAPAEVVPPPPGPLRVMVVGDSFAESIVIGLQRWGLLDGGAAVMDVTIPGCPFGRTGRNRGVGIPRKESAECAARDRTVLEAMAEFDPEVVLVAGGMWDVTDRRPSGFGRWTTIGSADYDAYLRSELGHLMDLLSGGGAKVIWANSPHWDPVPGSVIFMGQPPYAEADPQRVDAFNALLASVVAERPDIELFDLAGWMQSQPGGEFDPALRPDGVHFSEESTGTVALWLGPELVSRFGR